jgi:HEAT repeat protein
MTRQGSHGYAFAAALCCGLCLAGCAALGDVSAIAIDDPDVSKLADELAAASWTIDSAWSCEAEPGHFRWKLSDAPNIEATPPTDERLLAVMSRSGQASRNAAILLARHLARDGKPGSSETADLLEAAVLGERSETTSLSASSVAETFRARFASKEKNAAPVPPNQRAAAAEAWCAVLAAKGEPVDQALDRPARVWRQGDLPDVVKAELVRGLARHIAPERIVGFDELLPGDPTTVPIYLRQAAVEGCVLFAAAKNSDSFAASDWPAAIENARFDPDAAIRRLYGRWLAAARHPEAIERLDVQQRDVNPIVAIAAIKSLGQIRTESAHEALRNIAAKPAETLRNAAVAALANWSAEDVKPYLHDESPIVRRTAVSSLGRWPSPQSAVLLDGVLADNDLDVQRRAVEATTAWPDDLALPVLLAGLQNSAVRTRRECLDELRRRTKFEDSFPVTGDVAERTKSVKELCAAHGWPADGVTAFRLATTGPAKATAAPAEDVLTSLTRLNAAELTTIERDRLLESLRKAGAASVSAIEEFCSRKAGRTAELVATEVLPSMSPAHAALKELANEDVSLRRHGAGRLAELGRTATLSPFVLQRLETVLQREQDGLVWRQCMAAVEADATPGAERIALMAANNAWPDVRRLGCEYAGRHCRTQHAAWLVPLLTDGNEAVRLAAIDAAGRCANTVSIGEESGPAGSPTGLRAAAADPNRTVRFAALVALARLGDETGSLSLLRWAEYESPGERTKAIRAMADTGRRRFESDLMRLAWTERDASVRRELLTALEMLVPPAQRPEGALAISAEERLAAWAARWEATSGSSTMSAVPAGS